MAGANEFAPTSIQGYGVTKAACGSLCRAELRPPERGGAKLATAEEDGRAQLLADVSSEGRARAAAAAASQWTLRANKFAPTSSKDTVSRSGLREPSAGPNYVLRSAEERSSRPRRRMAATQLLADVFPKAERVRRRPRRLDGHPCVRMNSHLHRPRTSSHCCMRDSSRNVYATARALHLSRSPRRSLELVAITVAPRHIARCARTRRMRGDRPPVRIFAMCRHAMGAGAETALHPARSVRRFALARERKG